MFARFTVPSVHATWRRWGTVFLALVGLVLLDGCATGQPRRGLLGGNGRRSPVPSFRSDARSMPAPTEAEGSAGGFFQREVDAFQVLQEACGLEAESRHPVGGALYLGQARQLWGELAKTRVTQRSFGPRLVLSWLLREALAGGGRVEYAELLHRTERFHHLVVMRPDGYLVGALNGHPLQRLGQVKLVAGELKVGSLVVGAFYFSNGGVIYPVDEALGRANTVPWAELGLERDWLNAALDGAQDAVGEMALALAQSVLHPIRTVEALTQLPTTVALLIASSPEYFARYAAMSLQDQIREAARLSTHLLLLYGGAVGTVGRIGGLGAELPVLSVSAEGVLAVRTVVVPAGTVTTTLGAELGAVSILHMASSSQGNTGRGEEEKTASPVAPGRWVHKTPTTTSAEALGYQEQVTGQPASRVYMIGEVEFDGFTGKELLEAKGPRYIKFFNKDGTPKYWFVASGGFNGLVEQAARQWKIAERLKLPLIWHVADAEVAKFLRAIFKEGELPNIDVRHTPPAR
jgi:hypothetical protein